MPEKELDAAPISEPRCPKCGGETEKGTVNANTDHRLFYLSENAPKGFFRNRGVAVQMARACYRCGYVEFYLDPAALARSISKP